MDITDQISWAIRVEGVKVECGGKVAGARVSAVAPDPHPERWVQVGEGSLVRVLGS